MSSNVVYAIVKAGGRQEKVAVGDVVVVDRLAAQAGSTVELSALAFQSVFTLLQALVYYALWLRQRRPWFATWALAWALYALRLQCIAAYIVTRHEPWLFAHQAATGLTTLSLLLAALQFSRGLDWRWRYAWLGVAAVAWWMREPRCSGCSRGGAVRAGRC